MSKRVVITGMGVNTPIGDNLDDYIDNLIAGKSALSLWKSIDTSKLYAKVGGDLGNYDTSKKLADLQDKIPVQLHESLRKYIRRSPWFISLSILTGIDAWIDSGLFEEKNSNKNTCAIIAGHNLEQDYVFINHNQFLEDPDFVDPRGVIFGLDTSHAGHITEFLDLHDAAYTVGGACASGNFALRSAVDEIRFRDSNKVIIISPVTQYSPLEIQGLTIIDAISYKSFNDRPEAASRPYDIDREGFVPSHCTASIVLEDLDYAKARGARIYAEVLGVEASADANSMPNPSKEGQASAISKILSTCNINAEEIDYINAHATSTPLGDLCELDAIKDSLGKHAYKVKINAPKSMLGHACWSASTVETVAGILQMQRGKLHPSINIDNLDPQVDLDVCANTPVEQEVQLMLKNSFGFGGLNCVSLIKRYNS